MARSARYSIIAIANIDYFPLVSGFLEHDNEISGSIWSGRFDD